MLRACSFFLIMAIFFASLATASLYAEESQRYDGTTNEFITAHRDFIRLATGEWKDIEVRYLFEDDHNFKNSGGANLAMSEALVAGEVPIVLTRDTFLRASVYYANRIYDFHNLLIRTDNVNTESLHKIQIGGGFGTFVTDDVLITGVVKPGIYSNLRHGFNSEYLNVYGELFVIYRFSPHAQIIGGAVTNELFENIQVYPVLAARFLSPSGRYRLNITPPVSLRAAARVNECLEMYTGFWLTGDRYRVNLKQLDEEFNVQIQDRRLGVGSIYFLSDHTNVSIESGITLTNRFELKIGDSAFSEDTTEPSFYGFLSFGYVF
jgi:hypothetical protein